MKRLFLLFLIVLVLAGCAVNTRYVSYTGEQLPAKAKYYFISIYPEAQPPVLTQPYRLIGRVETQGLVGDGVNEDTLADEARAIARAKGADAIINVRTESDAVGGTDVIPGYCGRYRCHPTTYVSRMDTLLRFRGELIAFTPVTASEHK